MNTPQAPSPITDDRLLISLLYGSLFGVYGGMLPFTPLILREQALTDSEITLALSSFGLSALFSPLIVSHFADRSASVKSLLPKLILGSLIIAPLWLYLSSGLVAAIVSFAFFSTMLPSITLLDAFTVNFTQRDQQRNPAAPGYQSYRVWGSVGFLVPSILLYLLSNSLKASGSLIIGLVMVHAALSFFLARRLPSNSPLKSVQTTPSKEALSAALKPPLRGIFCATTVAGLGLSIFYVIFPRFIQELGHPIEEVGLLINLGVLFEIAVIPFTGKLTRRFGVRTIVLFALWTIPFRLALITMWPTTEMILLTQCLHAPLVMGLFVCVPVLLGQLANDSYRFSLQSINTALVLGVARLVGPWLVYPILNIPGIATLEALRLSLIAAGALGAVAFAILFFSSRERTG